MAFKRTSWISILCTVLLAGCLSRTDVTSRLIVNKDANLSLSELIALVEGKASDTDGECKKSTIGINCRFKSERGSNALDVNAGVRDAGELYLSVHSSMTSWLPATREQIIRGTKITQEHRAWELWMLSLFPEDKVESHLRKYSSFDIQQEF